MKNSPVRFGLIGCGGFGKFCLETFSKMEEIEVIAVADVVAKAADETAQKLGLKSYHNPESLLNDPEIQMVHIATTPHTHATLGLQALKNGKHVLCEKPLALSFTTGKQMVELAKQKQLILPVDFVLRYVPITDIVKEIIQSKIFGEPIHAFFENYASDESLTEEHWFWDKTKSGGIFIEHGVHFFDLYNYWFGNTNILWAHALKRGTLNQEDRVFCCLQHKTGVLSNHYHGFDQPNLLDRQTHRILLETGDITIGGWIPMTLTMEGIVDDEKIEKLLSICPSGEISTQKNIDQATQMKGRGKIIEGTKIVRFEYNSPLSKEEVYAEAVRALLSDQIKYIRDSGHQRIITEENGLDALRLAVEAKQLTI
ncbi:MAG: Gfo/Idh/MocA family protein [Candidatus Hodarchaeales archaeon]|jgi:predicted dehydrogenase